MKKAFVSAALPSDYLHRLTESFKIYLMPEDILLPQPVRSHPDMNLSLIGKTAIIPFPFKERFPGISNILTSNGYMVIYSKNERGSTYPLDCSLNHAVGKNFIIMKYSSADPAVKEAVTEEELEVIDVKQGYAGCSSIICDDAVITSDKSIANALEKHGIENIYVNTQDIILPGYNMGFIGGSGGYSDNTLYFFGNPVFLDNSKTIFDFASKKGFAVASLLDRNVFDFGGIKFF